MIKLIGSIAGHCHSMERSSREIKSYDDAAPNHIREYVERRVLESSSSVVGKDNSLQRTRVCWFPSTSQKSWTGFTEGHLVMFQSQLNHDIPFKSEASSVILNSTRVCSNSTRNCTRPRSRKNDGVSYMLVVAGQVDKSSNQKWSKWSLWEGRERNVSLSEIVPLTLCDLYVTSK